MTEPSIVTIKKYNKWFEQVCCCFVYFIYDIVGYSMEYWFVPIDIFKDNILYTTWWMPSISVWHCTKLSYMQSTDKYRYVISLYSVLVQVVVKLYMQHVLSMCTCVCLHWSISILTLSSNVFVGLHISLQTCDGTYCNT